MSWRGYLKLALYFWLGIGGAPRVQAQPEPQAEPAPVPRPPMRAYRLPAPADVDRMRGIVAMDDSPYVNAVHICRGPGKGCSRMHAPCDDCFRVFWHDQRPSAEILAAMERGDA